MTLNFPSSPTNGQTYSLANGATYTWDGEKWKASNIPDSSTAVQTVDTPSSGEFLKWNGSAAVWDADNNTTYTVGDGGLTQNNFTNHFKTKLQGIETGADATDATNVAAAGAVMESDTTTASMSFVVDEDNMSSNSNTKVPTQQSVKAYVDNNAGGIASVVADTTPQLGGDLDLNSNDITGTGNIEFTGNLTVTSTNTGSGVYPYIDINRNSASPAGNDSLGMLRFTGENNNSSKKTYSSIISRLQDPTTGSEQGKMDFSVLQNGTASERIVIQGVGRTLISNADLYLNQNVDLVFEGANSNAWETTLTVTDPTQDNTITLPDATGTVVLTSGGNFTGTVDFDGNVTQAVQAVSALNIDCSNGNYFTKTIGFNSTFTVSNVPASGTAYSFTLEITHTLGTITWWSGLEWPGGTAPTLTAGKTHLFVFVTDDGGTRWRGAALADYTN